MCWMSESEFGVASVGRLCGLLVLLTVAALGVVGWGLGARVAGAASVGLLAAVTCVTC